MLLTDKQSERPSEGGSCGGLMYVSFLLSYGQEKGIHTQMEVVIHAVAEEKYAGNHVDDGCSRRSSAISPYNFILAQQG